MAIDRLLRLLTSDFVDGFDKSRLDPNPVIRY